MKRIHVLGWIGFLATASLVHGQEWIFYASHTTTAAPAGTENEMGDFDFSNPDPDIVGITWGRPADYNGAQTPSGFKAITISADPRKPDDPLIASTQTVRLTLKKGLQLPDGAYRVSVTVAAVCAEADFAFRDNAQDEFTPADFKETGRDLKFHTITLFEKRKIAGAPGKYFIEIRDLTGPTYRNIFLDQIIFTKIKP